MPALDTKGFDVGGGGVMIVGGIIEIVFGVEAEGKSQETVARPQSAVAPLHKAAYSPVSSRQG